MRYINILAIGGNAYILQSVTAICQLDVLYFGKALHINNRDTGCHYIQVCPLRRQEICNKHISSVFTEYGRQGFTQDFHASHHFT